MSPIYRWGKPPKPDPKPKKTDLSWPLKKNCRHGCPRGGAILIPPHRPPLVPPPTPLPELFWRSSGNPFLRRAKTLFCRISFRSPSFFTIFVSANETNRYPKNHLPIALKNQTIQKSYSIKTIAQILRKAKAQILKKTVENPTIRKPIWSPIPKNLEVPG